MITYTALDFKVGQTVKLELSWAVYASEQDDHDKHVGILQVTRGIVVATGQRSSWTPEPRVLVDTEQGTFWVHMAAVKLIYQRVPK